MCSNVSIVSTFVYYTILTHGYNNTVLFFFFFTLRDRFTALDFNESVPDFFLFFFVRKMSLGREAVSPSLRILRFSQIADYRRAIDRCNGNGEAVGKSALTLRVPIMRERAISKHGPLTPLESMVAPLLVRILKSLAAMLIFPECVSIPIQRRLSRYSLENCERAAIGLVRVASP